jgi:excisionase family DNA binding protein
MSIRITDTEGAAALTGLAKPTLEKLRHRGEGPKFLKLGRAVRYRTSDLEEWLASHLIGSTSEGSAR